MRPGQTVSRHWHKAEETGDTIRSYWLLLITLSGLFSAGFSAADYISSSWNVDGMVSSSDLLSGPDGQVSSRLFACNKVRLDREIRTGEESLSLLRAESTGPILIDTAARAVNLDESGSIGCIFANRSEREQEVSAGISGILQNGEIISELRTGGSFRSGITVNGTGLISLYHRSDLNSSTGRTSLSGKIAGWEEVVTGE